jgi:hypothetical protein
MYNNTHDMCIVGVCSVQHWALGSTCAQGGGAAYHRISYIFCLLIPHPARNEVTSYT